MKVNVKRDVSVAVMSLHLLLCLCLFSHIIDFKFFNVLLRHEPLKVSGYGVLQEEKCMLYIYWIGQRVKKELWTVTVSGKMLKIYSKMFTDLSGFLSAIHVHIHFSYQKGRPRANHVFL